MVDALEPGPDGPDGEAERDRYDGKPDGHQQAADEAAAVISIVYDRKIDAVIRI
jgi:hypothetical protein